MPACVCGQYSDPARPGTNGLYSRMNVSFCVDQGCGSGSAFIFPPGSGSAFTTRIRIQEGKILWKNRKCKEIGDNWHFITCLQQIWTSFNLVFHLQKTLHKIFSQICLTWIRIRIKKAAGSRSALRKTARFLSAKNECGLDPQLWCGQYYDPTRPGTMMVSIPEA